MQNKHCSRSDRLGELIHKELANVLVKYCKDPRLDHLTITNVRLSRDLSLAKIYFTHNINNLYNSKHFNNSKNKSYNVEMNIKQVLNILNNANSFLKCRLAETLSLRKIPELKFFYDDNLEHSLKMEILLSNL